MLNKNIYSQLLTFCYKKYKIVDNLLLLWHFTYAIIKL